MLQAPPERLRGDMPALVQALREGGFDGLLRDRDWQHRLAADYVADPAWQRTIRGVCCVLLGAAEADGNVLSTYQEVLAAIAIQFDRSGMRSPFLRGEFAAWTRAPAPDGSAPRPPDELRWLAAAILTQPRPEQVRELLAHPASTPALQAYRDYVRREIADVEAEMPRLVSLTPRQPAVDEDVRAQYELHPFPNWVSVDVRVKRSPRAFAALFPDEVDPRIFTDSCEILVAGCGTGRHAVSLALGFPTARVTGIDFSRRSLAIASLRSAAHGCRNLQLRQADLTRLDEGEPRYAAIEAVGVLHHIRAWPTVLDRLLTRLLPGGILKLGLYSRHWRTRLHAEAAAVERHLGVGTSDPEAFLEGCLYGTSTPEVQRLLGNRDLYNRSGFVDLLSHAYETSFTVADIAGLLPAFGLRFQDFSYATPRVHARFRERFPRSSFADLDRWAELEAEEPYLHPSLLQFYCVKPRASS